MSRKISAHEPAAMGNAPSTTNQRPRSSFNGVPALSQRPTAVRRRYSSTTPSVWCVNVVDIVAIVRGRGVIVPCRSHFVVDVSLRARRGFVAASLFSIVRGEVVACLRGRGARWSWWSKAEAR